MTIDSLTPPELAAPDGENNWKFQRPMMRRWSQGSGQGSFSTRAPSKRRVQFSTDDEVRVESSYVYLAQEEIKAIWYRVSLLFQHLFQYNESDWLLIANHSLNLAILQSKDYRHFDKDKKDTINKLKVNGGDVTTLDPERYCLRGIEEYQSVQIYREKRNNRLAYTRAILEEQERQRLFQVVDSSGYFQVGRNYNEWATQLALQAGERDERHARLPGEVGRQRMQRRDSQRWVPVDSAGATEEDIPRGGGRRDSLNLTKLKSSIAAFKCLMEKDPELCTALSSDDGSIGD